jgi:hypothetical protein
MEDYEGNEGGGRESKKGQNMIEVHCTHTWKGPNETHIKTARKVKKGVLIGGETRRRNNRGDGYNQSTLYVCVEISQWHSPTLYN